MSISGLSFEVGKMDMQNLRRPTRQHDAPGRATGSTTLDSIGRRTSLHPITPILMNPCEYKLACVRELPMAVNCSEARQAVAYWRANVAGAAWFNPDTEALVTLLLDAKLAVKGHTMISVGALNECHAHPREILRPAIVGAAYAFILMHNHPSGDPAPSHEDGRVTKRIAEAAQLMQIRFMDHIIVGDARRGRAAFYSFRDAGIL